MFTYCVRITCCTAITHTVTDKAKFSQMRYQKDITYEWKKQSCQKMNMNNNNKVHLYGNFLYQLTWAQTIFYA